MCPVGLLFAAVIMLVSISSLYSPVGARQGCDFVGSVCYMKLVLPFLLSAMDSICCDGVASVDIVMFIFPSW